MIIKEINEENGTLTCAIKDQHVILNEYTNDKYLQNAYDMKIIKRQPNGKKMVIIDAIATSITVDHQGTPNSIQWNDAIITFMTREGAYMDYQLTPEAIVDESSKDIHICYYDTKNMKVHGNTNELILTTPLLEYINTLLLKARKPITEYVIEINSSTQQGDDSGKKIRLLLESIGTVPGEVMYITARIVGPYKSQINDTVKFKIIEE